MKRYHICLISLYGDQQQENAEPTAILSLKAALVASFEDIKVNVFTFAEGDSGQKLKHLECALAEACCLWVGISVPQGTLSIAKRIIEYIRTLVPCPTIVLGHSIPTLSPREVLKLFPETIIVLGWGDAAVCDLTRLKLKTGEFAPQDLQKLGNISLLQNGIFIEGKAFSPVTRPKLSRTACSIYPYFPRIEASRGCSYNRCAFCPRPESCFSPPDSWVPFPAEQVLDELRALSEAGLRRFTFSDEDFFGAEPERGDHILSSLAVSGNMHFSMSARLNDFFFRNGDERKAVEMRLGRLKRAGLSLLFVGLESLSCSQLSRFQKGFTLNQAIQAIEFLTKIHHIPLECGFILFDPFTTMSELKESLANMKALGIVGMIGQPLNHLRIRRGTSYVDRAASASLLGSYSIDHAEYEYMFQCPDVCRIFERCRVWKDALDQQYLKFRNIKRTSFDYVPAERVLATYRAAEISLLEIWVKSIESGNTQEGSRQCRHLTARIQQTISEIEKKVTKCS